MQIAISKYQLQPACIAERAAREGALLKVLCPDGLWGYADCHPWPELGDHPLKQQLSLLANGHQTSLTKQSLMFAQIDAQARELKKNMFQGMETPRNHYLVSDRLLFTDKLLESLAEEGIRLIKVKAGNNFEDDCHLLKQFSAKLHLLNLKLRLDFNCKLDEKQFLMFLKESALYLDVVDFFEDPFPYEPIRWQEIREKQKIRLACDRNSLKALAYPHSCDFLVVKPAIQEVTPFLSNELNERQLVLTSYLDHPIGQLSALYMAGTIFKSHPHILSECGFLSYHAYVPSLFSLRLKRKGSQLIPSTDGYGIGYDEFLKNLNWTALS